MTKLCGVCVFILLVASASNGYAADKNTKLDLTLPHVDLENGYSVRLNTDMPKQADIEAPPALSNLRQDTFQPFLGLKLSKPLDSN